MISRFSRNRGLISVSPHQRPHFQKRSTRLVGMMICWRYEMSTVQERWQWVLLSHRQVPSHYTRVPDRKMSPHHWEATLPQTELAGAPCAQLPSVRHISTHGLSTGHLCPTPTPNSKPEERDWHMNTYPCLLYARVIEGGRFRLQRPTPPNFGSEPGASTPPSCKALEPTGADSQWARNQVVGFPNTT